MTRIRTAVLLGIVAVVTVAIYVSSVVLTTRDQAARLDSDTMTSAAKSACTSLRADLDALPALAAGASLPERQERIAAQTARMRQFVTQVQAVGDKALEADQPAKEWLRDWGTLAAARDAYAAGGLDGDFSVPVVDGQPLTRRMSDVGVAACVVPPVLTASP